MEIGQKIGISKTKKKKNANFRFLRSSNREIQVNTVDSIWKVKAWIVYEQLEYDFFKKKIEYF